MKRKYDFGFQTSQSLRLCRVEEILCDIIDPVPSRDTLVSLIEDGTLEGVKMSCGWVVYEHSFKAWVRSFQPQSINQQTSKPRLRLAATL
jgi:hypothetical protein